jgi:hypothetical protein
MQSCVSRIYTAPSDSRQRSAHRCLFSSAFFCLLLPYFAFFCLLSPSHASQTFPLMTGRTPRRTKCAPQLRSLSIGQVPVWHVFAYWIHGGPRLLLPKLSFIGRKLSQSQGCASSQPASHGTQMIQRIMDLRFYITSRGLFPGEIGQQAVGAVAKCGCKMTAMCFMQAPTHRFTQP